MEQTIDQKIQEARQGLEMDVKACSECSHMGYFASNSDHGISIERCDVCGYFVDDDCALQACINDLSMGSRYANQQLVQIVVAGDIPIDQVVEDYKSHSIALTHSQLHHDGIVKEDDDVDVLECPACKSQGGFAYVEILEHYRKMWGTNSKGELPVEYEPNKIAECSFVDFMRCDSCGHEMEINSEIACRIDHC